MSLSTPDDLLEGQSSTPDDDLLKGQSSSPDDLPVGGQSSSPDDLHEGGQSSSPDDLPKGQSSLPDDLPEGGQSSSPDDLHEGGQSSSPDDLLKSQSSLPDDLPEGGQSSSPDDLTEGGQSSSPDDLPKGQSSLPDDLPEGGQSSSPDDLHEGGQSSSPDDLLKGQSSSPDDLLKSQSSLPDDLPEGGQSSSPKDLTEGGQSSSPDDLPKGQSSLPDDLPEGGQSSSPDDLHEGGQSSSSDDLLKGQSSLSDDLPEGGQLSSPDNLPEGGQSSLPDDLPEGGKSNLTDNLHEDGQSSLPDDLHEGGQSSSPDDLLKSQSNLPDDLLKSQSNLPDDLPEGGQSSSPDDLPEGGQSSSPDDLPKGQSSSPDDLPERCQSSTPDDLHEGGKSNLTDELHEDEKIFDWNKYLTVRNAEEVPEDFFYHVCKSELNGIEIGSVVEIENDDQSGYWFASVCSSKGVLMNLHYFGDDNDQHTFWLEVKSPRIHSLNWGSENNKKLIPPYPERFSRFKPEVIKEKVQDSEHVVSNAVLEMGGAPIHNIFKCDMFVEVQDKEYPYRVWISKVLKNVAGRLFLQMQGTQSPEEKPFWLFYLNERVFPLGWAEQKGLPWRVMNLDASSENSIDSSVLLNVLKPKTPEQHSYKVGEMLEVINPYSMMVFYVGKIAKIYDNRYFKVEVDNEIDIDKRISFVATKENPYLFHAGWASKHNFLLKTPTDWDKPYKFSWSKYLIMKNTKHASVDNSCRKKINNVHIGMKLEAVDPLNPDCIRVATVKGFADHWMFLSFDRTKCCQELLHLRSVYSDEVFPVGWCNKHKYSLGVPKLPYNDSNDFEHCYYSSDVDIDLSQSDQDNFTKYPHYLKGEIFYHFSKKDKHNFDDGFEEKVEEIIKTEDLIPTTSEIEIKNDSDSDYDDDCPILEAREEAEDKVKKDAEDEIKEEEAEDEVKEEEAEDEVKEEIKDEVKEEEAEDEVKEEEAEDEVKEEVKDEVKEEAEDLDHEFHDALFLDGQFDDQPENNSTVQVNRAKEFYPKKTKKVNLTATSIENMAKIPSNMFSKNSYQMCVYFNKDCYPGGHVVKKKLPKLPKSIGPGPVSKILREAISLFIDLDYTPWTALRKIKKIQNMLFNGPGGVELWISTHASRTHGSTSESLLLPESKRMAQTYCSALCNLSGMCEFFMTTEDTKCPHRCNSMDKELVLKSKEEPVEPTIKESRRRKRRSCGDGRRDDCVKRKITNSDIARIAEKQLDWSNKPLVARYKYYMGNLINLESHLIRLNTHHSEREQLLITKIQSKKNLLRMMDDMDVYSNTRTGIETPYEKRFIVLNDWKSTFENFYRTNPRFKKFKIDIGQIEPIKVTSNPKFWSPEDVYKYLSNDLFCKDVGLKLFKEEVDGIAFMLLNEEQLLQRLRCTINLAIRIMCHVAQVKFVCLTKYCNMQDS